MSDNRLAVDMTKEELIKCLEKSTTDIYKLKEELKIAHSDNRDLKELIVKMSMRMFMGY